MPSKFGKALAEGTIWITIMGVLMLVVGAGAILIPFVASRMIAVGMAWVFLVGGVVRLVHAVRTGPGSGFRLKISASFLNILISGLIFLQLVGEGVRPLSLALGLVLITQGMLDVFLGLQKRPDAGWEWVLGSGVLSMILGILLVSGLALGAIWLIGVLVGISLIGTGSWFVVLSLGLFQVSNH